MCSPAERNSRATKGSLDLGRAGGRAGIKLVTFCVSCPPGEDDDDDVGINDVEWEDDWGDGKGEDDVEPIGEF